MIKKLTLENFKSFKKAELELGNFTLLIGANASGKSNIRDAFRFLHGVGRGYSLADIVGEKWGEGGRKEWAGIRGGPREIAYSGSDSFRIQTELVHKAMVPINYSIAVSVASDGTLALEEESLAHGEPIRSTRKNGFIYSTHPNETPRGSKPGSIAVHCAPDPNGKRKHTENLRNDIPVITQRVQSSSAGPLGGKHILYYSLGSLEFLELDQKFLRERSFPGQTVLGDRGDNLPSVLGKICEDKGRKKHILQWIRELTPMEITDFEFKADPTGQLFLMLKDIGREKSLSAYSASDGTLRFLGMIAALFQDRSYWVSDSEGARDLPLLFIEEIETGIHPAKVHLLVQLIENVTREGNIQVVATTHSPQVLSLLSDESFQHAHLTYRPTGAPDTRLKRIADIPDVARLKEKYDISTLHYTGWFEDVMDIASLEESK